MSNVKGWDKQSVAKFLITFSEITATASAIAVAVWKLFFSNTSEPSKTV